MTTETTDPPAGLTTITVNLVPASMVALRQATTLTGDTNTDTINRAVQAYAALLNASTLSTKTRMTFDAFDDGRTVSVVVKPAC